MTICMQQFDHMYAITELLRTFTIQYLIELFCLSVLIAHSKCVLKRSMKSLSFGHFTISIACPEMRKAALLSIHWN